MNRYTSVIAFIAAIIGMALLDAYISSELKRFLRGEE